MIITISGNLGSGKSTVGRILAKKLKLKHYSTGDFMRQMAKERKISLEQLGDLAKTDPTIDQELDRRQIKLGKEQDNFIIDARLGFHFLPQSIKIFLDVNIEEGAKRILKDIQSGLRKEEQARNLQEITDKIKKRKLSEKERYQKYYGLDPQDKTNYDLVIDTTNITAEEATQKILDYLQNLKKTL